VPWASQPYADLQKIVSDAKAALEALTPDEVNALEGQPVVFRMPNFEMPFKAEAFLMSVLAPEPAFPRHHGLRHPAGRAARRWASATIWVRCGGCLICVLRDGPFRPSSG
jgi:hypothetical protein